MPVTNYTAINGVIVHEDRGGVGKNYIPDTLGSTAKLADTSVTDTYEYWSYGELKSHTGSSTTKFTYVGTLGYCGVTGSQMTYVRARMYMASRGRWATVDPLWPQERQYEYVSAMPQTYEDSSGLSLLVGLILYFAKCGAICDKLEIHYLDVMDQTGGGPVGETICCCGSPYVCLYPKVLKRGLTFILECIAKHEMWHARDTANCNGQPDGPSTHGNPRECEAHMISYSCVLNSRAKCKKSSNPAQCESDVDVFFRSECSFFKRNNCTAPKECAKYEIK